MVEPKYVIARPGDATPIECPCGTAQRAFTEDPDQLLSLHEVTVSTTARAHYHKRLTEVYYVLEGEGHVELDGELHPVRPGDAVLIKPGCRHRAVGELKLLNMPVPAFDPEDEWFD